MKREIELICDTCKREVNCVCNSFMVHVHEDELEVECMSCKYDKLKIHEAELDYCIRRLEDVLKTALGR